MSIHVFKSLPPDVLHFLYNQIAAAERPLASALESTAQAIAKSEAFKDLMQGGLVPRLTGADLVEFVESARRARERWSADATRRSSDQRSKKQVHVHEAEGTDPVEVVSELLGDYFQQYRGAWEVSGGAIWDMGGVIAAAGDNLEGWLLTERINPVVARDTHANLRMMWEGALTQEAEAA